MSQPAPVATRRPNAALKAILALAAWSEIDVAELARRYRVAPSAIEDSLDRLVKGTALRRAKEWEL
jgi:hypothetical protein